MSRLLFKSAAKNDNGFAAATQSRACSSGVDAAGCSRPHVSWCFSRFWTFRACPKTTQNNPIRPGFTAKISASVPNRSGESCYPFLASRPIARPKIQGQCMPRDKEVAACDPIPIDPDGFNPKAKIPFGVKTDHVRRAMQDFIDFLGFVNSQLNTSPSPSDSSRLSAQC
jgi:hypothetical protein